MFEGTENISNDSAGFELSVPARPNAPTGLTATAPTTAAAQGKITGTTADMQYKSTADGSEWNDCSSTETAVATGVLAYEIVRQRLKSGK